MAGSCAAFPVADRAYVTREFVGAALHESKAVHAAQALFGGDDAFSQAGAI